MKGLGRGKGVVVNIGILGSNSLEQKIQNIQTG
jgi:hypothetical protein